MSFINISNLSFSYESSIHPIFSSLNQTFNNGWYAIIGVNGSGKSTLFNLLNNTLMPQEGTISPKIETFLCKQDNLDEIPSSFYDPEIINNSEAVSLLGRLEIKDEWLFNYDKLSGGEKKRCMVADALLRSPTLLLIDEPINHLDSYSINLLVNELKKFNKIGLIISHNLDFLDSLCSKTLILEDNHLFTNILNYECKPSLAIKQRKKEIEFLNKQKISKVSDISKLKKMKEREYQIIQKSKNKLSKKNLDKKDFSTKSKIDGARITSKDKKPGLRLTSINNEIIRESDKLSKINIPKKNKLGISFNNIQSKKNTIISFQKDEISQLHNIYKVSHPYMEIKKDDKIIIRGQNGSGKTSFVNIIEQNLIKYNSPYWYIHQDYSEKDRIKIKDKLIHLDKDTQSQILSISFRLGADPTSLLTTTLLSQGETQKLLYGFAIFSNSNILLLDEPTNYLDIFSISILTKALLSYRGAIICVSHDVNFMEKIGNKFWEFKKNNKFININQIETDN